MILSSVEVCVEFILVCVLPCFETPCRAVELVHFSILTSSFRRIPHAAGATTNSDSGVTDLAKVAPAMEVSDRWETGRLGGTRRSQMTDYR